MRTQFFLKYHFFSSTPPNPSETAKHEIPFKDFRYVDELCNVYSGASTTSPVHIHLPDSRYENLDSDRDAEVHAAVYNQYCDTVQLKQKTLLPPPNHCSYVPNCLPSNDVHNLTYSNPNPQQQPYFFSPLVTTATSHTPEPITRSSIPIDYYPNGENYQQQTYYQPSSYSNESVENDPLALRHRNTARNTDKEAATVSPIINIQDLTGYTGRFDKIIKCESSKNFNYV